MPENLQMNVPEDLSETLSKHHESWNIHLKIYKWTMVTFNTSNPIYGSDLFLCANASWFLQTCIDKMVNWKDPALLLNDSCASCGLYVGQYCHWQSLSCFDQINLCHWWHLHVCSSLLAGKRKLISIATIESQLGNCVYSWLRVGHVTKKTTVQVDDLGELIPPYLTSRPLQPESAMMNVAIPRNALPCFFCFLLLHHHQSGLCKPKASLWGKTLVVLGFRAEMIVNGHVIAIKHSDYCKGIVATILSLLIEWEFDLARHCSMTLGHSPPSPSVIVENTFFYFFLLFLLFSYFFYFFTKK